MDAVYYHLPALRNGCVLNTAKLYTWSAIDEMLAFVAPVVTIVCSYPYLWLKQMRRRTVSTKTIQKKILDTSEAGTHEGTGAGTTAAAKSAKSRKKSKSKGESKSFLVLTLLTCSVIVSWLPSQVLSVMDIFTSIDTKKAWQVANLLQIIQPAVDPVLFAVSMQDLRECVGDFLRRFAATFVSH